MLLNSMLQQCKKKRDYFAFFLVTLIFFFCTIQMLSMIQYTSTAAFIAIGGYTYLLITADSGKRKYIIFFILEIFAFLLRANAMLMIQPMGIAVWFGIQLGDRQSTYKERAKRGLKILVPIILIVLFGILSDKVVYRSSEWQEYMQFKNTQEALFDFYGKPEYDEVEDILTKYDVTETEYNAYIQYTIFDYDVSVECTQELVQYMKNNRLSQNSWKQIVSQTAENWFYQDFRGLNTYVWIIWIIALLWMVIQGNLRLLWPFLGLKLSNVVVWSYMIWKGRLPWRVTAPIFICEIFFLVALLWKDFCRSEIYGIWKRALLMGVAVVALRYTYLTGQMQYRFAVVENRNNEILIESMYEIEEYCRSNPQNKYILGANSMSYFRGNALDVRLVKKRSSVMTGSWFSNSPSSREYLKSFFGEAGSDLHLIVYDEIPLDAIAVEYLSEKTGNTPILTDSFSTSSGAVYSVYYFGKQ